MIDPLDFENRHLIDKLGRKRKTALLVMLFEQASLHCWRLFFWALLFCALWMIQIPAFFGSPGAVITLVVFFIGCIYLYKKDLRRFQWPSKKEIDRRLEKASNLKHRPISGLQDDLSNPAKYETRTLWEDSKTHMLAALARLKTPHPKAFTAKKDPYAIRLGIVLLFIIGLSVSGPRWDERIWNGLTPVSYTMDFKKADGISLWVTPPEYTGMSQIILEGSGKKQEIVKIPVGSQVKIRVTGGLGHPALKIGETTTPLEHLGDDSYGLETEVPEGVQFTIKQMFITRSSWNYKLIPDTPPVIEAKTPHEILQNGQIRFPLTVTDDYSVKDITMTMTLDEVVSEAPIGEPVTETRSVVSPAGATFDIQPVYDLTPHSWAGLPVVIRLSITDHIGQNASLPPIKMTLPEREFQHPVAKALIDTRKKLAWEPVKTSRELARSIEIFLARPSAFGNDFVVFLAIRAASSRLFHSPSKETAKAVIALLWDTALRIEDGNLTLAARNLRDAQNALENALKNSGTTDQEIAQLMNELRSAMAEYLMELQKELQKRMAQGDNVPMIPPEMLSSMIDPEALSSFLDQMESQMMSGDKNAAQEMLSQLQRMLDMMNPSMATPLPMDMQMMMEGVNELQELIDRQQELLDQTKGQMEITGVLQQKGRSYGETLEPNMSLFDKWGLAMEDMPPPPSFDQEGKTKELTINTQSNKVEQEALRFILGQLMLEAGEALDDIPEGMGLAEQEMRLSSEELGANKPGLSIPHQEKAIEHLKESMEQLSQQLMARIQQMTGMAMSGGGMKMDPLGRPYGGDGEKPGLFPGSRVKIPNEAERKRVEEILRLLRRRSGELGRPDYELDYYRRLLRQF
ncbi:MAG: membrane protein [Micavibrio sp.]|nr:MAG: membrane protein [Micavibrio sp.]